MAAVLSPPHLNPGLPRLPGFVRPLRPVGRARGRLDRSLAPTRPAASPVTPTAATYRRRQAVALLVVAAVALVAQVLLVTVVARVGAAAVAASPAVAAPTAADHATVTGAVPTEAAEGAPTAASPTPSVYVVRSGDTLWSIAQRLRPDADPRPLVDALAERAGSSTLRPGQQIDLDGLAL